jgi:hypothetical protein
LRFKEVFEEVDIETGAICLLVSEVDLPSTVKYVYRKFCPGAFMITLPAELQDFDTEAQRSRILYCGLWRIQSSSDYLKDELEDLRRLM